MTIQDMWAGFGSNTKDIGNYGGSNGSVADGAVGSVGFSIGGAGGGLGSLDIKRMCVRQAVGLSFMETFAKTGVLYELVADTSGGISAVEVGTGGGSLSPIYYSVQTTSYNNDLTDVLVTGGKPLPQVSVGAFYEVLSTKEVFTQQTMLENCRLPDFYKYATIVYKDPHLDTGYNDGIDNVYNITDAYTKLVGYVHYKSTGMTDRSDVKVSWSNESSIPMLVVQGGGSVTGPPDVDIGTVVEIQNYVITDLGEQFCYGGGGGGTAPTSGGIKVPIPDKFRYSNVRGVTSDGFIRVSAVYIIGVTIDFLFYAPKDYESMKVVPPGEGDCVLWASINRRSLNTFKCEEGRHYAMRMDGNTPYIVFAKETRTGDPFKYGAGTKFRIDPFCSVGQTLGGSELTGTVLPLTKSSGMLVFEVWATVDVEMPSINIFDPQGQAHTIAEGFIYNVAPITVYDPPAPVASANIGYLDPTGTVQNADPTDVQDFSDTPIEQAMDSMQGGGMSVTWSFLESTSEVESAASNLAELFRSQNIVETVYTCGPQAKPELCATYAGGYINAIRYSYTDQGSYTISVTVGPKIIPSSIVSVDGGPTPMMTENVSAKGTVIQSGGDNINFKVSINGYGDRWAVCMTPSIIRTGDVVQCSVHNNPVEY